MERVLTVAAVACMLLGQVGAQGSVSLTDFLTDPLYQPFTQIVLNDAPVCLTDQTIMSGNFDLNECPQILQLLQDVQNDSISKNITCSQACVDLFNTLGESCRITLINAFKTAKNPIISEYSNDFFGKCEDIQLKPSPVSPVEAAPSPSTSEPPVVEVPSSMDQNNPVGASPATVPDVDPVDPPAESPNEAASSGSKAFYVAGPIALFGLMITV